MGGAAAVASIAASLGAIVTLAGVVGRDEFGNRLLEMSDKHDIGQHICRDDRVTTWKQRVVARDQIRPDRCDREETTPICDDGADSLAEVPLGDVLVISDYGKGVCTERLLKQLVDRAHEQHVPILVDPARGRSWTDYGHVTLIKANWVEAVDELGDEREPLKVARSLANHHRCHVVVTLGERGLVCAERGGQSWRVPARLTTEVRDVCGAGDTVIAALAVGLARREALEMASREATYVAGQQVAAVGASDVTAVA